MKNNITKTLIIIILAILFGSCIFNLLIDINNKATKVSGNYNNWNKIKITESNNNTYSKINDTNTLSLEIAKFNKLNYIYKGYDDKVISVIGTLDSVGENVWAGYVNNSLYGISYCKININNKEIIETRTRLDSNCGSIEYFNKSNEKITENKAYNIVNKTYTTNLNEKDETNKISSISIE
ncbi:hypothetical protein [Clostridium sardiniense]|uniref:hypothetical protein n=1 Tax=Clostridium sardiniense TaxID=29369 RepID=UPI003D359569